MCKSYDQRKEYVLIIFSDDALKWKYYLWRQLKGDVISLGKVAIILEHSITNVLHVDSLSYNLLSVSQLCEMGYNCLFADKGVEDFRREDFSIVFMGWLKNKLYLVDFNKSKAKLETCLLAKSSMCWLWHRRLAHVGMRNLAKTSKRWTHPWTNKYSLWER